MEEDAGDLSRRWRWSTGGVWSGGGGARWASKPRRRRGATLPPLGFLERKGGKGSRRPCARGFRWDGAAKWADARAPGFVRERALLGGQFVRRRHARRLRGFELSAPSRGPAGGRACVGTWRTARVGRDRWVGSWRRHGPALGRTRVATWSEV